GRGAAGPDELLRCARRLLATLAALDLALSRPHQRLPRRAEAAARSRRARRGRRAPAGGRHARRGVGGPPARPRARTPRGPRPPGLPLGRRPVVLRVASDSRDQREYGEEPARSWQDDSPSNARSARRAVSPPAPEVRSWIASTTC